MNKQKGWCSTMNKGYSKKVKSDMMYSLKLGDQFIGDVTLQEIHFIHNQFPVLM